MAPPLSVKPVAMALFLASINKRSGGRSVEGVYFFAFYCLYVIHFLRVTVM
jgi:hypothetical protein